jgi:hypothetical protein
MLRKQGVEMLPVSSELRASIESEARAARERLGAKTIAPTLQRRVLDLLARYRRSHHASR